jgi:hypothetical protein
VYRKSKVTDFTADFMGIFKDGKGAHTHQISNFNPIITVNSASNTTKNSNNIDSSFSPSLNTLTAEGNASIFGTVDVGINGHKIWKNVKANITISEGKTIEILLNDDVDYHFGKGQPIYGLVNRLSL